MTKGHRPALAIHSLTALAVLSALFCASVPRTARPVFTIAPVASAMLFGVDPKPLP